MYRKNWQAYIGNKYGQLTVIGVTRLVHLKQPRTGLVCKCDCGKEIAVPLGNLKNAKSCGCSAKIKLPLFNSNQKKVVNGSLLGDGYISNKTIGGNYGFFKEQCLDRMKYLQWHFDVFGMHSCSITTRKRTRGNFPRQPENAKTTHSVKFSTKTNIFYNDWREKWYPDGIKRVPNDLVLTPLTLAVWFADDGENNKNSRYAKLHTNGFTVEEVEFLIDLLKKDLGLNCYWLYKQPRDKLYPMIFTRSTSYIDLLGLVSPYFDNWPSFAYKVEIPDMPTSLNSRKKCKMDMPEYK
jgi:hypothetical protein